MLIFQHTGNNSPLVFAEHTNIEDLVSGTDALLDDTFTTGVTQDTTTTESLPPRRGHPGAHHETREMYHTGLKLRQSINALPSLDLPWPVRADSLTIENCLESVPAELINFIAVVVGATDEPVSSKVIDLPPSIKTKILPICQDIVILHSQGRKQTPKPSHCIDRSTRFHWL